MHEVEHMLPRSAGERLALGLASVFFGVPLGLSTLAVLLTPMPPLGVVFTIVLVVTQELLLAATVVIVLCLIWAVAAPPWVESLARWAWRHLLVAIVLGMALILLLAILAAFGLKLGAGLGP